VVQVVPLCVAQLAMAVSHTAVPSPENPSLQVVQVAPLCVAQLAMAGGAL
jgi:hypothetical protein